MYQGQRLEEGISMINVGYENRFNQMIQDEKSTLSSWKAISNGMR